MEDKQNKSKPKDCEPCESACDPKFVCETSKSEPACDLKAIKGQYVIQPERTSQLKHLEKVNQPESVSIFEREKLLDYSQQEQKICEPVIYEEVSETKSVSEPIKIKTIIQDNFKPKSVWKIKEGEPIKYFCKPPKCVHAYEQVKCELPKCEPKSGPNPVQYILEPKPLNEYILKHIETPSIIRPIKHEPTETTCDSEPINSPNETGQKETSQVETIQEETDQKETNQVIIYQDEHNQVKTVLEKTDTNETIYGSEPEQEEINQDEAIMCIIHGARVYTKVSDLIETNEDESIKPACDSESMTLKDEIDKNMTDKYETAYKNLSHKEINQDETEQTEYL